MNNKELTKQNKTTMADEWTEDESFNDNPAKDDKDENQLYKSFSEMPLSRDILKGVYGAGFENPSPIQSAKQPYEQPDRNIIFIAKTGSGKTLAFTLVAANCIDTDVQQTQVVIIAPTRELVHQIYSNVIVPVCQFTNITIAMHRGIASKDQHIPSVGDRFLTTATGNNIGKEHIVIATPARFKALINEPCYIDSRTPKIKICLDYVQYFILDECDKLLSTSEKRSNMCDDIDTFLNRSPDFTRVLYYSATMNPNVTIHSRDRNPLFLKFEEGASTDVLRRHFYVNVTEHEKIECLECIIRDIPNTGSTIVFAKSLMKVIEIHRCLHEAGFSAGFIHGNMTQEDRDRELTKFRNNETRIIVGTDVLARGIDVVSVDLVFNFDVPDEREMDQYMHRTGRAGRYGKLGTAISFVSEQSNAKAAIFVQLENAYGIEIKQLPELDKL